MKLTHYQYKKTGGILLFAGLVVLGMVLIYLPANFFDHGQSICISVLLFHRTCYACGMTRAFQHLIHLEFKEAYAFNKLAFIAFPLLVVMILIEFKKFSQTYLLGRTQSDTD